MLLLVLLFLMMLLGLGLGLMIVVSSGSISHWAVGRGRRRKTVGEGCRLSRGARRRTDEERRFFRARKTS